MPRVAARADVSDILKAWRGNMPQSRAAEMLGVPLKTYQGWEQGRPMPYPRLLTLALSATRKKVHDRA